MKRQRMTQDGLQRLREGILELALQFGPLGVRGLFYQSVVAGLVEKTEQAYDRVQRLVKESRLCGDLDWDLITDESRRRDQLGTFSDLTELMDASLNSFHLDPWRDQACRVQVWIEKEGLSQVCSEITRKYCVPLFPGKGYTSLSFSRQAALDAIAAHNRGQKMVVLQWGDYDPSGVNISESLADHYQQHGADQAKIIRVGLKSEHIDLFGLPTRPTKTTDSRSKNFGDDRSVELDALAPPKLKKWIEDEIRGRIEWPAWKATLAAEKEQRTDLKQWIEGRAA